MHTTHMVTDTLIDADGLTHPAPQGSGMASGFSRGAGQPGSHREQVFSLLAFGLCTWQAVMSAALKHWVGTPEMGTARAVE